MKVLPREWESGSQKSQKAQWTGIWELNNFKMMQATNVFLGYFNCYR